jgi:hypothetical protein
LGLGMGVLNVHQLSRGELHVPTSGLKLCTLTSTGLVKQKRVREDGSVLYPSLLALPICSLDHFASYKVLFSYPLCSLESAVL